MDKDRDSSRDLSREIPKNTRKTARVGILGGAVLAGSAAIMAACGGGPSNATSKEGQVKGAISNPTTLSSIEVPTEMPSATAVQEAPTVTAVSSESSLTPDQMAQVANEVSGLLDQGFQGIDIASIPYDKVPRQDERDPAKIKYAIGVCLGTTPFPYRDANDKAMAESDVTWKATGISNFCSVVGEATMRFGQATGSDAFKQANIKWETVHHSIIKGFEKQDPRITENTWLTIKKQYYPFSTGTAN